MIHNILNIGGKIIDKITGDSDEAEKLKTELAKRVADDDLDDVKTATAAVVSEVETHDGWLQRSWRPLVMLTMTGLVALHWLGLTPEMHRDEATALMDIVKLGLSGYIVGRSAEKVAKVLRR